MKKAIVFSKGIHSNARVVEVPADITCSWIAKEIGCEWVEIVRAKRLPEGLVMVVDEEGLLKPNDINVVGSYLYETDKHGDPIMGNVMILKEIMGPEGPEFAGMWDEDIETLLRALKAGKE